MSRLLRKSLGLAGYAVFLAVFVEIALQAFYYATAGDFLFRRVGLPIYAASEWGGFWNKPNLALAHNTGEFRATYYTNAEGLRVDRPGHEYQRAKGEDTYRIMLLGPSYAFGWGVNYEESFAAVLEQQLEAQRFAAPRDIEVINAGVPSMSSLAHLRWYERVGAEYQPDLVIQFVYATMAIAESQNDGATVDEDGYLLPKDVSAMHRFKNEIKKLATVFYGWVIWTRLDELRAGDGGSGSDPGEVIGAGREIPRVERFDPAQPVVAHALQFYRDLADAVESRGARLLVIYFPLSYAIHAEDVSRWKHHGVRDVAAQAAFDAEFIRHLNEAGIRTLDLTEDLRTAARGGERLYYWLDIHWTPEGNAVAASAVATNLVAGQDRARLDGASAAAAGP
jgi:hypothetical protein